MVDLPLFSIVQPSQYVFPILHTEIGLGNSLLKSFFKWVDYRVEQVSEEEIGLRNELATATREYDNYMMTDWEEWLMNGAVELADIEMEKNTYVMMEKERWEGSREFRYTVEERAALREHKKECNLLIKDLKVRKKVCVDRVNELKSRMSAIKSLLKPMVRGRGKMAPLRQELEAAMASFGIERPVYHGGELEGTKIIILLQKIRPLFNEFKEIILGVDNRAANDEEVNKVISYYINLGYLLDGVFSLARTESGKLDEEIILKLKRMIKAVLKMWRSMMLSMKAPKIHGLEDHLIDSMEMWGGIGCFVEDFVEQAHQTGVKDEKRTKGMRNNFDKAKAHNTWEARSNDMDVEEAKIKMRAKTSRKKRKRDERVAESKLSRDELRASALKAVEDGDFDHSLDDMIKQFQFENDEED